MDVDKCIPQDVIIDTSALSVMLNTKFAKAVGVNFSTLNLGPEFVTAKGKVVASMGTTPEPSEFVLSRGTTQELRVSLHAVILDTNAYYAILGMEFISAVKGRCNSYTEMFKYKTSNLDGTTQSCRIFAPCHTSTPSVVACAFHAGLICSAKELLDVQGSFDDQIPEEEEEVDYHHAHHQLAADALRDACLNAARHRTSWQQSEST